MKTIRMKKEDWEKWDAALRSGEYGQCEGHLTNGEGGYCCLGVMQKCLANEIVPMVDEEGTVQQVPDPDWLKQHGIAFSASADVPYECWIAKVPYLPALGETAANANDGGVSFIEIANAIKEAVEFTDA